MSARRTRPVARVLVFWDYDTQWGGDRSRMPGGPKDWGRLEFPHTDRLLEIHARFGVPACFAVVGRAALTGTRPYHDPAQVRRISAAGHEIASHSFEHEWLPGLGPAALRRTLSASRDALEQCVGRPVVSFVPPYNQPFDFPRRLAISLSERREASGERTDLPALCEALSETGYRFCRVSYRTAFERLAARLGRRVEGRPARLERIAGVSCARLNTPGGFDAPALAALERCASEGGLLVVYGHPHSLASGNAQDERHLVPFLEALARLRSVGAAEAILPSDLVSRPRGAPAARAASGTTGAALSAETLP